MPSTDAPHQGQPVLEDGAPVDEADAVLILLHGRGASAQGMLRWADEIDRSRVACLAPQAAGRSWYPESFLVPVEQNEPGLGSALQGISDLLARVQEHGIGPERTVLLGFSQGACLATTYAIRHPRRYGGIVGLSGGLIGPEGASFDVAGSLDETPVFLGCSDRDPYIPTSRVHETADALGAMDADVTTRIYEGMGHTINDDEREHVRRLLDRLVDTRTP